MGKLIGKNAVITGASSGIGRAMAIELAKEGANVVVNYNKNKEGAEKTLSLVREAGGIGFAFGADVGKYEEAGKLVDFAMSKLGKIDVLVNNAGISRIGLFMDMTEQDWDEVLNTNLKGVFNCCRHTVPHMVSKQSGSIINISSMWGNVGASCEVAYSAAKGGMNAFTKALAKELGPSNVRVNAIAPGVINTDMNRWLDEEEKAQLNQDIPLSRFGDPEEVARMAAFLASDDSSYVTAQILSVDGGII